MKEMTYMDALREAFAEEMRRDEKVFIIGESVQAGSYDITTGLVDEFGKERLMDTPICENAISGAAMGAAMCGYRPVFDLMFADFIYTCADEVLLRASQWRFMHGGTQTLPIVYFATAGGGCQLANEHSQVPSGLILQNPGMKLVFPSTPYDAKGLLKSAIRDDNPVFFLWHKMLMTEKGQVPEEEYTIPLGLADVKREGSDVTVVAYGMDVYHALEAAEKLDGKISVEVIDPRSLEPLDLDTILKSVEKTGHLVIVDEDKERCGFASELGFQVMEKGFDLLDAPIERVCTMNYPIPGGVLESYVLPSAQKVQQAVEKVFE